MDEDGFSTDYDEPALHPAFDREELDTLDNLAYVAKTFNHQARETPMSESEAETYLKIRLNWMFRSMAAFGGHSMRTSERVSWRFQFLPASRRVYHVVMYYNGKAIN